MGAWAGKRQRPCANMDNARSLDQSCVDHEFIKSKPLGTRGARVLSRIFAQDPPSTWAIAAKNDEPHAVRVESRATADAEGSTSWMVWHWSVPVTRSGV